LLQAQRLSSNATVIASTKISLLIFIVIFSFRKQLNFLSIISAHKLFVKKQGNIIQKIF